ncbi:MAG: ATP-binding cassette domain-containing protein [Deltaproteobacteria bacterium]
MDIVLQVKALSKSFGGLVALRGVDLRAEAGQIVGLIGPNGAGKTTLFNCLTALTHPSSGQIEFLGKPIVPQVSEGGVRLLRLSALFFFILGWVWLMLFYSKFLPETFFKVELTLLGVFIFVMRCLTARVLVAFKIWAWSLAFVFLISDVVMGYWGIWQTGGELFLIGTAVPLKYIAVPWGIVAIPFSLFFMGLLMSRKVRQLYGFRLSPDALCRLGMGRTFQNIRLFFNHSVLDNVKIGFHTHLPSGLLRTILKSRAQREEEQLAEQAALESLRFVVSSTGRLIWPGPWHTGSRDSWRSRGPWWPSRIYSCWTNRRPV